MALIEWLPATRFERGQELLTPHIALPPFKVAVPSVLVPSKKVTVPVAPVGATVAVNINGWPDIDGLGLPLSIVVVLMLAVWSRVAEEPGKLLSPL
jgi:hypothetical protein